MTSSRTYYAQYDIWSQDGAFKPPPQALADSVKEFVKANRLPIFEMGSPGEMDFLELSRALNVTPKRVWVGKFNHKRIDNFAFYLLGALDNVLGFVSQQFDTEHLMFKRQIECSRELHLDQTAGAWGCGNGKIQVRKICIYQPHKIGKRDIFRPALWPFCNQRLLVVTRRVRDELIAAKLTGFTLTPVLDGKKKWSARELEYDYVDEMQERDAQWFQLTITEQNVTPIPLVHPLSVPVRSGAPALIAKTCEFCNHNSGDDSSLYKMHEKIHPMKRFAGVDLQAWDYFDYSGQKVFVDSLSAGLVASSRFIELVELCGFKGIARGPRELRYQAMLVKEEIETTLDLDQIASYPVAGWD